MSNPARHILSTQGVTSEVRAYTSEGTDLLGHVLLADLDLQDPIDIVDRGKGLPGITALFESSPGSFHLWNLTVRPIDKTALSMVRLNCDYKHVRTGLVRTGRWVIRYRAKNPSNAEDSHTAEGAHASAPEYWDHWVNSTDQPQSRPHYRLLLALLDDPVADRLDRLVESRGFTFTGSAYRHELYRTATRDLIEGRVDVHG